MVWFDTFREPGWNTYYASQHYPASVDLALGLVLVLSGVTACSLLIIVVGTRGQERWTTFFRLLLNLQTGVSLLLCLAGQCWQSSNIDSHCSYSPLLGSKEIYANIGIRIGLKSINITLTADSNASEHFGRIFYNEKISVDGVHDAELGLLEAKQRGLPEPIIYIMEYLAADAGGLRWCRSLRGAGHLVYILLWTALVGWIVGCLLLSFVISRGAALLSFTGALVLASCFVYHSLQPASPLIVPFEDAYMKLTYGWSFWLAVISGAVTLLYGLAILLLNLILPEWTAQVFLAEASMDSQSEAPDGWHADRAGPLVIDTPNQERKKCKPLQLFYNEAFCPDGIHPCDISCNPLQSSPEGITQGRNRFDPYDHEAHANHANHDQSLGDAHPHIEGAEGLTYSPAHPHIDGAEGLTYSPEGTAIFVDQYNSTCHIGMGGNGAATEQEVDASVPVKIQHEPSYDSISTDYSSADSEAGEHAMNHVVEAITHNAMIDQTGVNPLRRYEASAS